MPGILDVQNDNRRQALGQFGQLAGLETQRNNFNRQMQAQAKAQRKQGLGSGIGTLAMGVATGNPVGMVMGGIQILGSLF